ncbi:MAG TPA: outer membrane beta-barrel family protein [Bacteroidales bacterium]|nr:outer membrane beta-barrel family protein [Bacteroidales bacterium]
MRKFLILLFCLSLVYQANARLVLTGLVTDKLDSKPVEGALVELLRLPDSSTVESTKTTSDGLFLLYKMDTVSSYGVRIKHLIYKELFMPVTRKSTGMINNLGTLTLDPAQFNLKEIVIKGVKVSVTELGDRTVYGIPEGIQKTSTDGVDVLRKIPSVQVDYLNEDITVNGKSNIKIEVDGISRDKGYLKRLHPSQISKMEIITSPSGKYDSDVDAVINVVTNPAMRYGLKGMAYVGAFPIANDSYVGLLNGSLDYGLEKISYYVAANAITQNVAIQSDMLRQAGNDVTNQSGNQSVSVGLANVNLGFIYDPDKNNDISFNMSYNNTGIDVNNQNWNRSTIQGINNMYRTESTTDQNNGGLTTSLFYKHSFDQKTQHGLEAELKYYNSLNNRTISEFQNTYMDPADSSELYQTDWLRELSNTKVQTLSGQSNYNLPFDSVYFFNVGVNGNFNHYVTNNTNAQLNASEMNYTDNRIGGYAELSKTLSKGNIKLGTRFETSSVAINGSDPRAYYSLLPYVNGFWRMNRDNSIKLAYSRRVIRPSVDQLNPLESAVDSLTIAKGNMNLKPAYRDNFQFTYNWKFSIKNLVFNLSPQLFYEYKTGLIQTILSEIASTGRFESKPTNISNGYEYGSALALNSQLGPVMLNSNFRYTKYHVDAYLDQIAAMNRGSWNWNSFAMSQLPKNFNIMAMVNVSGPVLNGQTVTKNSMMYLIGLGKQFKNNSQLRLMAYNPLSQYFFSQTSTIDNASLHQVNKNYLRKDYGFMLLYVYSFKLGNTMVERSKRTEEQQDVSNPLLKMPVGM